MVQCNMHVNNTSTDSREKDSKANNKLDRHSQGRVESSKRTPTKPSTRENQSRIITTQPKKIVCKPDRLLMEHMIVSTSYLECAQAGCMWSKMLAKHPRTTDGTTLICNKT